MPSTRKFQPWTYRGLNDMVNELRILMMNAAEEAPTAAGLQLYSVVVVTYEDQKKALAALCRGQKWIAEAPVLVVFCADIHRFEQWLKTNKQESHYRSETWLEVSKADAYIYAQTVSSLLRERGYGTCFSGFVLNSAFTVSALLSLPGGVFPLILMGLGLPEDIAPNHPAERMQHALFIHYGVYNFTGFDFRHIEKLYAEKAAEQGVTVAALFKNKFYPERMVVDGDKELAIARERWRQIGRAHV